MRLIGAALASVAFLAVSCSSSGGQAATVTVPEATATPAAPTAEPTPTGEPTSPEDADVSPTATAAPSPTEIAPPTNDDLARIVITLDDLPPGWSPAPNEDDADDESLCGVPSSDDDAPAEEMTATFSQSDFGPFLIAFAVVVGDAPAFFDELAGLFEACDGTVEDDGTVTRVLPVSFPDLGDETFATRLDLEGPLTLSVLITYVRRGDVVIGAAYAAVMAPVDAELVEEVNRTMLGRLPGF